MRTTTERAATGRERSLPACSPSRSGAAVSMIRSHHSPYCLGSVQSSLSW